MNHEALAGWEALVNRVKTRDSPKKPGTLGFSIASPWHQDDFLPDSTSSAPHGMTACQEAGDTPMVQVSHVLSTNALEIAMIWTAPAYTDLRIGFEVTAYVYVR